MIKKLTTSLAAASMLFGAIVTTAQPAQAGGRGVGVGVGIAAGIIGLGLLAGASRARAYGGCYAGPRRCEWDGRNCYYNRFGDYVCRGGQYHCWRPTICN